MRLYFLIILGLCIVSCDEKPNDPSIPNQNARGVYILNEGNFQYGNASLDFYDLNESKKYSERFKQANLRPLGDVLQSAFLVGDQLILILNNSSKIEVIDIKTNKSISTINQLGSPRHMAVDQNTAFISELYENVIHVIDLEKQEKVSEIITESWTEQLYVLNNHLYVLQKSPPIQGNANPAILVFALEGHRLVNRIDLAQEPIKMIASSRKLWVLLAADGQFAPQLQVYNKDLTIDRSIPINIPTPIDFDLNELEEEVYLCSSTTLFSLDLSNNMLNALDENLQANYYTLDYLEGVETIWVSDVGNYLEKSRISQFSTNGNLLIDFEAGIISNGFVYVK